MDALLNKLLQHEDLSFEEAYQTLLWIMSEDVSSVKASTFLALLQSKSPVAEEVAGAAQAMRERSTKIAAPDNVIDTCSTGGNGISTFNISTCAAFIASGAGAVVAKHGNRSNSRKSGSAEALQALGVNIDLETPEVEACLQELDLCFCYAIHHHPAMKFAGPIRKEMGIPTIFNMLGPLTNPANAKRQVIGVPHPEWTLLLAKALQRLGSEHVMIVSGAEGLCELSTFGPTQITELRDQQIIESTLHPEDVGLPVGKLDDIRTHSPEESARLIEAILVGEEQGTARHVAVLNAAAGLVVAGKASSLKEGVAAAQKSIDDGAALDKLKRLIAYTRSHLPQS